VKKLLSLADVSEVMNRSPRAIRALIYRGRFPFSKIGGRIFTDPNELSRFLKLSRKVSATEAAKRVTATPEAVGKEAA
jgi:hypothetical protein